MGPLLPLLRHPLKRGPSPDDERRRQARPRLRAEHDSAPGLDGSGAVLRVLRCV